MKTWRMCLWAVLAALAAGLAAPAGASAAPEATAISIQPVPPVIVAGSPCQLRLVVSSGGSPLAAASLSAWSQGVYQLDPVALSPVLTDATGKAQLQVAPALNTTYRLEYAGDEAHQPASVEVLVRVRPRITTSFPKPFWLGRTTWLKGRVVPAHPGSQVTIERKSGGVWGDFKTVTLEGDSSFSVPFKPTRAGIKYFRIRMAADAEHALAVTTSRRVVVNHPNPHGIPIAYPHYLVADYSEFRLYYYEHGQVVRKWACVLGKPSTPTPLGHFKIYAKQRDPGYVMGPYKLLYYGSIGIHGTSQPWLLNDFPRAYSHGCTRLTNSQITWLYERVPVGTPVWNIR